MNLDLVDPSNRHMTVIHSPSVPSTIVERYSTITLDESTAPGCAVLQRRPMTASTFAEFAAQWPTVADDAASIGLRAAGAWPMFLADGTVLGALSAGWSIDTEFSVLLRSALLTMAQMAAASLERTRIVICAPHSSSPSNTLCFPSCRARPEWTSPPDIYPPRTTWASVATGTTSSPPHRRVSA